jgi:hypothetical protein
MIVKEQQISPTVNPGASYLFESWYVAREDVNIYNSMATRAVLRATAAPGIPAVMRSAVQRYQ